MDTIRDFYEDVIALANENKRVLPYLIRLTWILIGVVVFIHCSQCSKAKIQAVASIHLDEEALQSFPGHIDATSKIKLYPGLNSDERKYFSPFLSSVFGLVVWISRCWTSLMCRLGDALLFILKGEHAVIRGLEWLFRCIQKVNAKILLFKTISVLYAELSSPMNRLVPPSVTSYISSYSIMHILKLY